MNLVQVPESAVRCENLAGGDWRTPRGGETLDVVSPYTGGVIGTVPLSTRSDVDVVVEGAAVLLPR